MAQDPEALNAELQRLVDPGARGRLHALGLARSVVWRRGVIPAGGPRFPDDLTENLLDFGYGLLALALELRDTNAEPAADRPTYVTDRAFTLAAECIESAMRRGDPLDPDRGRHLVVAAAAFHLGGFAARSFSLLPGDVVAANLATIEHAFARLLRRELGELRQQVREWLADPRNTDDAVARSLVDEQHERDLDDAVVMALNAAYFRAVGGFDSAMLWGDADAYQRAITALELTIEGARSVGNLTAWWIATLTKHLARDLWAQSLHVCLPSAPELPERWNSLRRDFIDVLAARRRPQIDLWPSQLDAARRAADPADDLIVALPTSSGKTRIAELCILRALADSRRVIYVTPLRALSAQVEHALARTFVPLGCSVTSLYGAAGATTSDVKTLATADIVVATPEKLDFALRQDPHVLDDVSLIVLDEGHMIGSGSREVRYEVLIQRLLRRSDADSRRIVCLSAMFNAGDVFFHEFGAWLRNDEPGDLISIEWRPTRQLIATLKWQQGAGAGRLEFMNDDKPFVPRFLEAQSPNSRSRRKPFPANDKEFCVATALAFARDGHDVLVYSPQRRQIEPLVDAFCTASRQGFLGGLRTPAAVDIQVALTIGREWMGDDHPAVRALPIGVGTHHGALPRPFLSAIEELLNARRLPVVVASPTLAQGIDLACSVLVFRSVQRFDRSVGRLVPIAPSEFSNVLGRAGRAFVDLDGIAVLPAFKSGAETSVFLDLVKKSRGQRLVSGIVLLVWKISQLLASKLAVPHTALTEYVVNQRDLWSDARLQAKPGDPAASDADDGGQDLDTMLSDLDVAIFSLIGDADAPIESLATLLDQVLAGSLWKRTLVHVEGGTTVEELEREIIASRARWVWRTTTAPQRKACFSSGLGQQAGVFLHDNVESLVQSLADLNGAVERGDADAAAEAAVAFAETVLDEPFFVPHDMPAGWKEILGAWIRGAPFADILATDKKAAGFIHDGVVFKLVWAAEAVRVQATAADHSRAPELRDAAALALTHGLPSLTAALICQFGYPSRTGALWLVERLPDAFTDYDGFRAWEYDHADDLGDPSFWASADHRLLWERARRGGEGPRPTDWTRTRATVDVSWRDGRPAAGVRLRAIPLSRHSIALCDDDLTTLAETPIPFDCDGCAVQAIVDGHGRVELRRFGPE